MGGISVSIPWGALFFDRRRRPSISPCRLGKIFKDSRQHTLQLLFPGQDLGFKYEAGWLSGQSKSAKDQFDLLEFKSKLKLGGRMPHFWLDDKDGQQASALDLPSLMISADRLPCYVMLVAGKADLAAKIFNVTKDTKFHPIVIVEIIRHSQLKSEVHCSFHHKRPHFLPPSFAVIIRPDGHIAWLHTPQ